MLFLLKIAITPRWWPAYRWRRAGGGRPIGGLLMGLPWFTGPVLFVLTRTRASPLASAPASASSSACVCWRLHPGLRHCSRSARWPLCSAGGLAAFAAGLVDAASRSPAGERTRLAAPLGALGHRLRALAILCAAAAPAHATGAAVAAVVGYPHAHGGDRRARARILLPADAMGPQLSGILATYPVILTVVGTFTQHRWGRDAVLAHAARRHAVAVRVRGVLPYRRDCPRRFSGWSRPTRSPRLSRWP